jgi:hypothetical protein
MQLMFENIVLEHDDIFIQPAGEGCDDEVYTAQDTLTQLADMVAEMRAEEWFLIDLLERACKQSEDEFTQVLIDNNLAAQQCADANVDTLGGLFFMEPQLNEVRAVFDTRMEGLFGTFLMENPLAFLDSLIDLSGIPIVAQCNVDTFNAQSIALTFELAFERQATYKEWLETRIERICNENLAYIEMKAMTAENNAAATRLELDSVLMDGFNIFTEL